MNVYYLEPKFGNNKSFYKKAVVIDDGETIMLRSYQTIVAEIVDGKVKVYGWYSQTTARHINEFLQQYGFDRMSKKEMEGLK